MSKAAPLKLLIVDDHAALRRIVRQMFEGPGVTILEASSGEEAVKMKCAASVHKVKPADSLRVEQKS